MGKLFDLNNPFWVFIGKFVDVVVLHIVWLICCIPIVTIGPATVALYYTLLKDTRDEGTHYVKDFFKSFKLNMKQGIALGLIVIGSGLLIAFAVYFYMNIEISGTLISIVKGIAIVMVILYVMIVQYAFALLARFDNTVVKTIKNAFIFSIRYIGWTILMTLALAAYLFFTLYYVFVPLMILGLPFVIFIDCYMLNHIFKPFVEQLEEKRESEWEVSEEEADMEPSSENSMYVTPIPVFEETKEGQTEEETAGSDTGADL